MKKFLTAILLSLLTLSIFSACTVTTSSGNKPSNKPTPLPKTMHTITLITENSSNDTVYVEDGEALILSYTPYKDNYIFKGWYTDSECCVLYDFLL